MCLIGVSHISVSPCQVRNGLLSLCATLSACIFESASSWSARCIDAISDALAPHFRFSLFFEFAACLRDDQQSP